MSKFLNISTDNTLGGSSASDESISSQKAVKDYVDTGLSGKANDSDVVKLTGNQTVGGIKTFTSAPKMSDIELYPQGTGSSVYIDFHYNNSTSDYTSRIIESSAGNLEVKSTTIKVPTPTEDTTASVQADTVGARNTKLQGYADNNLSNLSSTGKMIIDSDNGSKSQCILEILQNIKVTLFNNVVTLKSGSILANTGSTYSTVTISGNKTYTISDSLADGRYVMFANANGFGAPRLISNVYSGTSSEYPTSNLDNNSVFYNTIDKLIYRYNTDSSTWTQYNVCYPVCLIDMVSGVASIAQNSRGQQLIFNSVGYIGHHIFNFPNQIKYLGGNGKDSKGRLMGYENTLGTFNITEMAATTSLTGDWFRACVIRANNNTLAGLIICRICKTHNELLPQSARLQYVEDDNICYVYSASGYEAQSRVFFCRYEYDGTTVSDFILPEPVRTATVEMLDKVQAQVDTNTTAITTKADDSLFTGADGTNAGAKGLVPAPAATDNTKFLKGDGTWGNPASGDKVFPDYPNAQTLTLADGNAPADGWLYIKNRPTAGQNITINGFAMWLGVNTGMLYRVKSGWSYAAEAWVNTMELKFIPEGS